MRSAVAGFALMLLVTPPSAAAPEPTGVFDACEAMVRERPRDEASYRCFYVKALGAGRMAEAAQRLERVSRQPTSDRHWAGLFLALLASAQGQARAERLFEDAAAGFTADGHPGGAVRARTGLARFFRVRGRLADAERQVAAAEPLAIAAADPVLAARVSVERAFLAYNRGDYGSAWRVLKEVEATTFASGAIDLQSTWLSAMGATCWATHRISESLSAYRRQAELLHDAGDAFGEVAARDNVLFVLSLGLANEDLAAAARATLAAAEKVGNWEIQARALLHLATATTGAVSLDHARRALALARGHAPGSLTVARRAIATRLVELDPDAAFRLIDEGIAEAGQRGDRTEVARNWVTRSDMRWKTGSRGAATADSLRAIEAVEAIRNQQPEALVRARRFSMWWPAYTRLVGHLLSGRLHDERPSESDLELVFSIMERRRARMLLDQLDAARAVTVRAGVAPATPSFLSLSELRAAMGPHEAVLGFQISARGQDPPLGGSWLLVHTRTETRVYEMPDPTELDTSVSLFNGLIARRDGSERAGARRLYTLLLQRSIADLPPTVRRLIIIPDAMLFNVPFPALQDASGEPIGARYEVSIVPSATAWLTWRRQPGNARPAAALALADPAMTIASGDRSDPRLRDAARIGPLPQARREAAAVRRSFAEATVRLGADASEQFIKSADLRDVSLLHIAAHGLIDEVEPDRSAIVLSPGSAGEDGLLQVREIVNMQLRGVVVLSACRSASGTVLSGEGMMGLAHAFFQAGAQTVVASLWPLRDDDAAAMFQSFYDQLGKGLSVNAALRAARADAISREEPGAAWAGIVTLGNGDVVPIPGGAARTPLRAALLIALAGVSLLALLLLLRTRPLRR